LAPTSNKVEKPKPEQGTTTQSAPADEEIGRNWPRFRGPGGLGISAYTNVPTTWNAAKGENILWKTAVPLPGNNSPVVWGDRVFLSGATAKRREVFCFDALRGTLLWQKEVPGTPDSTAKPPKVMKDTGFAAPTTTTDGRHVFAIFANGDIAAFGFDGTLAWARSLGMPANSYGHASSLTMYKNVVLVQFDQGMIKERKSKFFALDAASGKTVWEITRDVPNSWTSPIVIRAAGRDQLITAADPWVIAYNPADGKEEIWRANCLRQDVGPSPTFCDGIVYVANEFPRLSAIRADGRGDVTATHVIWRGEDNLPNTCSPLATKEHVFILSSEGTLTCYDAKKGDKLWEHDFPGSNFSASPSLVGSRIYVVSNEGKSFVIEPGQDGCKIVGEGNLGEECVTSPAFQDGRIYLRGYVEPEPDEKADGAEPQREDHLFCIGAK
jgi:outer membrane protein assembly factor BamB